MSFSSFKIRVSKLDSFLSHSLVPLFMFNEKRFEWGKNKSLIWSSIFTITFEVNRCYQKKIWKVGFLQFFFIAYFAIHTYWKISSAIFRKGDKEKETSQKHQNMSFPKSLLNQYPFISILRLQVSLLDEHCFNPWTENHSVTQTDHSLQGKQFLVKKQTLAAMQKCHWMIPGTVPSKN